MRRPFGHFSLILGTAFLFGCPSDDTGSGEGTTGGPTTSTTASTSMSTSSPSTTDSSTTIEESSSSGEPETGTTGTTGTGTGTDTDEPTSTGTGGGGDLVVNFTDYNDFHPGLDIHLKVFSEDDTELGSADGVIDANPYTLTIAGEIEEGMNYTVRWWVDVNANDTCDPEPVDHMWELSGQVGTADGLTIDHAHDGDWTDVCPSWR